MRWVTFCTRSVPIPIYVLVVTTIFVLVWPLQYDFAGANKGCDTEVGATGFSVASSAYSLSAEDILDYSRCSLLQPLRIFVHDFDHTLAKALQLHPTTTKKEKEACMFIAFTTNEVFTLPSSWGTVDQEPGSNHVVINLKKDVSIAPRGSEMIMQAYFVEGSFRPLLDFSLFTDVPSFNNDTWKQRPIIMPPHRKNDLLLVADSSTLVPDSILSVDCEGDCSASLNDTSFCLLPPSSTFQSRLLSSLRAGCIPVLLSSSQSFPFQDQLDWTLASFRYPLSQLSMIPEILKEIEKEELLEMRRRGRIFLARIDDAQALANSIVAALAVRINLNLPMHPEVHANVISTVAANAVFQNTTSAFKRARSKSHKISASKLYSRARWNDGRALTYSPRSLHDVPMMPGDAGIYEGIKEHFRPVNGKPRLGLTRDEEQFTVLLLTYDRDGGVKKAIEKLRDCPHLNKIIIVWNHPERRPNATWPGIHVPVEFIQSARNTLNSRFLPYDSIETEAVFSMDDDCHITQDEIVFGFKVWRENRDRLVGFPDRTHSFNGMSPVYKMYVQCEHSLVLTGLTFLHKEFLFEYSYNQHPSILELIDKTFNCEDIAMNFLVSHLTRKSPLKVIKKSKMEPYGSKPGLTARKAHTKQRGDCIQMFSEIYGYNPLLYSQEVVHPHLRCSNGL